MACFEKRGPECFTPDEMEGIQVNVLFKEFQKFFNLTDRLGRELIDDCPAMVQNEAKVLDVLTGDSERCNFHEYEDSRVKMKACRDEAFEQRKFRMEILPFIPNAA